MSYPRAGEELKGGWAVAGREVQGVEFAPDSVRILDKQRKLQEAMRGTRRGNCENKLP